MTVWLGLLAAASWGTSDFFGGLAGRRIGRDMSATIALASQAIGLLGLGTLALVLGGEMTGRDLTWACLAGVSGAFGVMFLYRGLRIGRMGVVAPVTGALAAAVPAGVSPLIGEDPGLQAWLGIVLAVVAIVIVAREPHDAHPEGNEALGSGIREAVLAGLGFAGVGIALNATADASELLPFLPMKLVASLLLVGLVVRRRERPADARGHWHVIASTGILDNAANVAYLFALRGGSLAVAATLASLYPVGTTLLARVVLHERLARIQQAGFALAIAAVVIIGLA
ncbi:MAG: DMT family transporter [Nitriliruptorales bacterium]|nr:DMT family transporter [Nitriliruptorales bacterium]